MLCFLIGIKNHGENIALLSLRSFFAGYFLGYIYFSIPIRFLLSVKGLYGHQKAIGCIYTIFFLSIAFLAAFNIFLDDYHIKPYKMLILLTIPPIITLYVFFKTVDFEKAFKQSREKS